MSNTSAYSKISARAWSRAANASHATTSHFGRPKNDSRGRYPSTGRHRVWCTRCRLRPAPAGSARRRTGSPGPSGPRAPAPAAGGAAPCPALPRPAGSSSSIAHPTIPRLNWSWTSARYSHPSAVGTYVISAGQAVSGPAGSNPLARTFPATGSPCRESVVRIDRRKVFARMPESRITFATALSEHPCLQLRVHPGAPVAATRLGVNGLDRVEQLVPPVLGLGGGRRRPRRDTRTQTRRTHRTSSRHAIRGGCPGQRRRSRRRAGEVGGGRFNRSRSARRRWLGSNGCAFRLYGLFNRSRSARRRWPSNPASLDFRRSSAWPQTVRATSVMPRPHGCSPDLPGRFVAVHSREADVEQHHVGPERGRGLHRFDAVAGGVRLVAGELQQVGEGLGARRLRPVARRHRPELPGEDRGSRPGHPGGLEVRLPLPGRGHDQRSADPHGTPTPSACRPGATGRGRRWRTRCTCWRPSPAATRPP